MKARSSGAVTADDVLAAAAAEFAARGYETTTLDKIGKRLGITRQGVLHHFSSKDSVFFAVLERERQWAGASHVPTQDVLASLRSLRAYIGATPESRKHIRLVQVLHGEGIAGNTTALTFTHDRLRAIDARILAVMTSLESAGGLQAPWEPATASAALASLIQGLQARVLVDNDFDVGAVFDTFVSSLCAMDLALSLPTRKDQSQT